MFGTKNKWGYFPSGSIAWIISEEEFLANSLAITNLKVRASYGIAGNQGINPYQSLARLSSPNSLKYPWIGAGTTDIGFGLGGVANPDLKWETTA